VIALQAIKAVDDTSRLQKMAPSLIASPPLPGPVGQQAVAAQVAQCLGMTSWPESGGRIGPPPGSRWLSLISEDESPQAEAVESRMPGRKRGPPCVDIGQDVGMATTTRFIKRRAGDEFVAI